MKSTARLSRDFKGLEAQASTFLNGIDLFHFNLTGKAGSGIHLEGKGEARSEARLAQVVRPPPGSRSSAPSTPILALRGM